VNGRVISSAERALQVRKQQARERAALTQTIEQSQARIVKLQEERAPLAAEFRKIEAEVGPIKYIAALIYGDNPDQNLLEQAVRWVIILIVIVFDPLALTLILAANKQLEWARKGRGGWIHDEEETKPNEPSKQSQDEIPSEEEHPLTEEEREAKEQKELEKFLWRGHMIAKAIDADEAERRAQEANDKLAEIEPAIDVDVMAEQAKTVSESEEQLAVKVREQQEFLDNLAEEFLKVEARVTETEQRRAELEAQLAQAEQVKSDLQIAINATTAHNQGLAADKTQLAQDLITSNNTAAKLRIQLANSDTEVAQLKQYIESLQSDLQAAVALAQERNEKLNLALAQIAPPPVLVEEVAEEIVVQMPEPEPPALEQIIAGEEASYDPKLGYEQRYFSKYTAPVTDDTENADFGIQFPANPQKGDIFLRVDYLPSRLFKWNNSKWIEIDKVGNDRLAYNRAYIEHLIDSIRKGETDVDDLSQTEKDEIEQHLKRNDTTLL